MKIFIAPSILSADFGRINEEIKTIEPYADIVHFDVMDGHFVPNLTFGAPVIAKMKCKLPMHVHLMIENPEMFLEDFADAIEKAHGKKSDSCIIIHAEVCKNLRGVLKKIKKLGCLAGVSINPKTPLRTILTALKDCDIVLLMTVNPGFGGQKFIKSVVSKIRDLRKKAPKLHIAVDGGINDKTAKIAVRAGADILVAGFYIFGAKDRAAAINSLWSIR